VKPRLLLVDDEPDLRLSFSLYLGRAGFAVVEAGSLAEARQALVGSSVDAVLLDLNLPDGNGLEWIPEIREGRPGTSVVVMTGRGDIPTAVEAMRRGADHFLTKPVSMEELEVFLRKAVEVGGLRQGREAHRRLSPRTDPCFGAGPAGQRTREHARLAADDDAPVLLLGETGSGKGVLARWIHENSAREGRAFVELNCAGSRGELIGSELFGHARGAFTSAVSDQPGLLDIADGGTLFLDEIGDMDLGVQFLKVLEEKRYRRLGEVRERRSDFRLISASNRDLARDVQAGRFRADLHYRLHVFPIVVPPLRERREDIPFLVAHLLRELAAVEVPVAPEALERLRRYPWPGNVRELRNALERALLLSRRQALHPEHFDWLEAAAAPDLPGDPVSEALRRSGGDVEVAARELGISRATLYRRLKKSRSDEGGPAE
jgi:DNA-binding NtrC family response regulator